MNPLQPERPRRRSGYWAVLLTFGWTIAASLAVASIVGIWLDHRMKSEPLFLVLGVLAGAVASALQLRNMMQTLDRIDREQAEPKTKAPSDDPTDP